MFSDFTTMILLNLVRRCHRVAQPSADTNTQIENVGAKWRPSTRKPAIRPITKRKAAARARKARPTVKPSQPTQKKSLRPTAKPQAKPANMRGPTAAPKVKRKLNLSPERRAQLAAAMRARWAAKRAAAEATPQGTSTPQDFTIHEIPQSP